MRDFLTSLALFQALPESDLKLLLPAVDPVDLPAGKVLFNQGEPGDALYVVRSGSLRVDVTLPSGERHELDTLGPGHVLGEMAVLYGQPRAATVRAVTECSLLKISSTALDSLFARSPAARTRLLEAAARRLPSLYLASLPIFAGLDADALREFDLETNWVRLTGGQTLFRKGERPDYLYVVVRGRLEVVIERADGGVDVLQHLGQGSVVGEVAIFIDEPRNATVLAIRDTELVRLSKAEVLRLLETHPNGAIEIVRLLAKRVQPVAPSHWDASVSTIALVPAGSGPLSSEWTDKLAGALRDVGGPTLHVGRQRLLEALGDPAGSPLDEGSSHIRATAWLHEQEAHHRFVVLDCSDLPDALTDFCLRQADLVILVAPPGASPGQANGLHRRVFDRGVVTPSTKKVLVLLHAADTVHPTGTARWLDLFPVSRHHHVRVDRADDYARVARFIAGKAFGLALSGGGARTWAHVGVIRALEERGIPVDTVGAVSAGNFMAAYRALGNDAAGVERLSLANMGNYNLLGDATLPMASFLSGKGLNIALKKMYGDVQIEDMWLPFFCLSANLTTTQVVVHDRGPLWLAARATTSVPGILPPVCVNGELLVDGGVLNNLPVDVVRNRCPGTVIASDTSLVEDLRAEARSLSAASGWPLLWARISPFGKTKPRLPHIFEILMRMATLSSVHHGATVASAADIYVRCPTESVATFDWKAGTTLVDPAYRLTLQAIDTWESAGGRR